MITCTDSIDFIGENHGNMRQETRHRQLIMVGED
jgi:hypothetical protein